MLFYNVMLYIFSLTWRFRYLSQHNCNGFSCRATWRGIQKQHWWRSEVSVCVFLTDWLYHFCIWMLPQKAVCLKHSLLLQEQMNCKSSSRWLKLNCGGESQLVLCSELRHVVPCIFACWDTGSCRVEEKGKCFSDIPQLQLSIWEVGFWKRQHFLDDRTNFGK